MKFSFFTCLMAWETQEANAKPSITSRFLNACQTTHYAINNVLSVVSGTYSGGGGGEGLGLGGNHGGGGSGREMGILCAWLFSFLEILSSLSTVRLPSVFVGWRIIFKKLPCQHDLLYWLYILNLYTMCLWFFIPSTLIDLGSISRSQLSAYLD